jgi:hypothetical protein
VVLNFNETIKLCFIQGKTPDLTTLLLLCNWLGVSPTEFFESSEESNSSPYTTNTPIEFENTLDVIKAALSQDENLDKETANVIFKMVEAAYNTFQRTQSNVIEAHLRADRELHQETADAIVNALKSAYDAVLEGKLNISKGG